ncbi:MAG: hypothetical protein MEEGG_00926 [Eggerthella lenta]|uniref:glycosyltransferase family 2 protein n=1 Tax=Eggerthella lenta TaxID=84112 RepID=UPI001F15A0B5|nr:glycosyltransferase family 2 protein [Eggerthella lenta]
MPAISVIVPMYNVRPYIGQCIESLQRQTFPDFEAICIDDGSTDDTLSFARGAVKGDERFSFISQANAGQSAARNVGIDRAVGTYLLFLDSDDYYEEHALQALYDRAERDGLDDLFFSARSEYENARMRGRYRDDYDNREDIRDNMTGRELLVRFAETDSFCVSPAMQFIRRDFLEASGIRFPEGIVHEDNLFTCMVLAYAQRAGFLNEPLYVRRVRPGSTMTEKRGVKHVYGHFKSAYELEKWLHLNGKDGWRTFHKSLLHHIAFCYDLAAFDALSIEESVLDAWACELPYDEELSFRLHVIEHAREMGGVRKEYTESTTYRAGRAIMALPCWLKDRVGC